LRKHAGVGILYSIKALPLLHLLEVLKHRVDGFSVSSLFEARLAREILGQSGNIHLTSPGLRPDEFSELAKLCSHISFNSLSQQQRMQNLADLYSPGMRVNPKRSFAKDPRYDPCRTHSKLGVDIDRLALELPPGVEGLHVHNIFASNSFQPLLETLSDFLPLLKRYRQLKWLNLGGGYLYHDIPEQSGFIEAIKQLKNELSIEVFIEPGKAVIGNAGYLLTTILDSFISDGKTVLILDTSVNHHPEVFEYQRSPQLLNTVEQGKYSAILAGSSCLAGDVFGEYRFDRLPVVGERLVFANVGAYSLIKANRFNGYNLPDVYSLTAGVWRLCKHYDFDDYRRQWTAY
jgi:carboxynorspermidine decarboxylase